MYFLELTYLLASAVAVIAMAPQIKQLLITKESDELSLFTWTMWTIYQAIALIYSIALGIIPYIIVNIVWVAFYAIMATLIVRYRRKQPVPAFIAVEEPMFMESLD